MADDDDQNTTERALLLRNRILKLKRAIDHADQLITNLITATGDFEEETRVALHYYFQDLLRNQEGLKKRVSRFCESRKIKDGPKECNATQLDSSNDPSIENCETVCEQSASSILVFDDGREDKEETFGSERIETETETEGVDQECEDDETVLSKRVEGFESELYFTLPALFVLMQQARGMEEEMKFFGDFNRSLKWLASGVENRLMDKVVVVLSIAHSQLQGAIKKSEVKNSPMPGKSLTDITEETFPKKGRIGTLLNQILEEVQHVAYLISDCDNLELYMPADEVIRRCEEELNVIKSRMKELEENLG